MFFYQNYLHSSDCETVELKVQLLYGNLEYKWYHIFHLIEFNNGTIKYYIIYIGFTVKIKNKL